MNKSMKLNAKARPYVLFQRTDLLPKPSIPTRLLRKFGLGQSYNDFVFSYATHHGTEIDAAYSEMMKAEADKIGKHLPDGVRSILDIGCGIAALHIHLNDHFESPPNIYLLDKSKVEDDVWYNYERSGAFYNSLELAQETLSSNGIEADKILLLEAPDDGHIDLEDASVDVIVSTISWGFHYPVGIYLDSVSRIMSDNGALIIDIRNGTEGKLQLETKFSVTEVETHEKHTRYLCTKV